MSNELVEAIDQARERFIQLAPSGIDYEAEKSFALQILKNNVALMEVAKKHPQSLGYAIANVAAVGLSLNPVKKQAYLIQRTISLGKDEKGKKIYQQRIFLEPSYMGLCDIATQSNSIEWVQAECVHEHDTFLFKGLGEKPDHNYNPFKVKERGNFVGVYCVAKLPSGDHLTRIMDAEKIFSIRDRSEAWKAGKFGPWATDFEEMAKKSVIRNASKTWPKKIERLETAVHLSNENEGFEPILTEPKLSDFTGEQKGYYDSLIENSDALGMYVFSKTIDEATFTNLYHSFEKGQKGKYQRVIDNLLKSGQAEFQDYVQIIEGACQNTDDLSVKENMEDMHKDLVGLIKENVSHDALTFIEECGL